MFTKLLMLKTSNPILRSYEPVASAMKPHFSAKESAKKAGILFILLILSCFLTWNIFLVKSTDNLLIASMKESFSFFTVLYLFLSTAFLGWCGSVQKEAASLIGPLYAIAQGLLIGTLTSYLEKYYPGYAVLSALGTMVIFGVYLYLFINGTIKVGDNFENLIEVLVPGLITFYIADFVLALIGLEIPLIHKNGYVGIAFSLFSVVIPSVILIWDFHFIRKAQLAKAPKDMEWFCAFGLVVSVVWLYIEVFSLLLKLKDFKNMTVEDEL
jgi:uncharacterized YccA/Bax inhibitor family protein